MILQFADCEFNPTLCELRRNGEPVAVEPQVFALLAYLIENRHRVVAKEEILDEIWNGRIVSDSALSSRIKSARQAVGDSGAAQAVIATLHKRGFRFVADVTIASPRRAAAAANDVAVSRAAADAPRAGEAAKLAGFQSPSTRVAVLPITPIEGAPKHQLIADGLTADVITRLGRTRWMQVVARGTAFQLRGGPDPLAAAELLGASYVVDGTLQVEAGQARLRASLADAASGAEVWARSFDRPLEGVFALQEEMADAVAAAVATEIAAVEQRRALFLPPDQLDAWTAYHRGVWHMYRFASVHYEHAERFFLRAAELAPQAPGPLAGLSFVHWQRAFLDISPDRAAEIDASQAFAERCLERDPAEPQGRWALGRALLLRDDFEGSVAELRTSVELNPSSIMALYSLARSLMFTGALEESNEMVATAHALSPFDPMVFAMTSLQATNYSILGDYPRAAEAIDAARRQPNAHHHIDAIAAVCHQLAGNDDEARRAFARLQTRKPGYAVDDYLRAFPFQNAEHVATVRAAFRALSTTRADLGADAPCPSGG